MAITNYSEMADAVAVWLNREGHDAVTDNVEDFVAFGQRRIHRIADLNAMEEVVSLTVDAQTESVPADFLRVKTMIGEQGSGTWEILGAPHRDVMLYNQAGRPIKYSHIGDSFYFGPVPDQTYTVQLAYYKALPVLSSSTTTNWFTDNNPELLLYAALVEALLFLKDDQRAQYWEARFQEVLKSQLQSDGRADKESGGLQVRIR